MNSEEFETAVKHFHNSLKWLKLIFEENLTKTEEDEEKVVKEIGVFHPLFSRYPAI
jgi:hypothetical protein